MNDIRSARLGLCGAEGNVDLSSYLGKGPIFAPLAEPSYFQQFTLEGGTLARPNGDSNSERLIRLVELNCFVSREVSFVGDLREPILNPLSENKAEKGGYKRERRAVRNTP
jgi:hypothetical protein